MNHNSFAIIFGVLMVFVGLILALYTYGVFQTAGGDAEIFIMSSQDKKKIPFELFKYSLFVIGFGAVTFVFQTVSTNISKSRERRLESAEATQDLRNQMLEVFGALKNSRRKFRLNIEKYSQTEVSIDKQQFYEIYSEFLEAVKSLESLLWQLAVPLDFLGKEQEKLRSHIDTIEKFMDGIIKEIDLIDRRVSVDKVIFYQKDNFYTLVSATGKGKNEELQLRFFSAMTAARSILKMQVISYSKKH